MMETMKPMDVTSGKGRLRRTFAKVINIKKLTGVVPEVEKVNKIQEKVKIEANLSKSFNKLEEEYETRLSMEALLAKLFATISSIKSGYAQLQYAQSPYDPVGIQKADNLIVTELKVLSELKQSFLKQQIDPNPDTTLILAEIQELRSLLTTYDIMKKKMECQLKLKDSEILFLKEKFQESLNQNKLIEKRLINNQSNQLHLSGLNSSHFVSFLHHTVKSVRVFVKLMIGQMRFVGWDVETAAESIESDVFYYKKEDKCFAFEHFVCKIMFESFHLPYFTTESSSGGKKEMFFERFKEVKSMKVREYLTSRGESRFARFCKEKYLQLVNEKMEEGLFGSLNMRERVLLGVFPETGFMDPFLVMAKRVWVLHCLSLSFDPEVSIFGVCRDCRFSEVYMKSVTEEVFYLSESEPKVAFTVVPGFRVGKTLVQCEVYLSRSDSGRFPGEGVRVI